MAVKILQSSREIIDTDKSINPNLVLLLSFHIKQFSWAGVFVSGLFPFGNLQSQSIIQSIKNDKETSLKTVSICKPSHLNDIGVTNDGEESAFSCQVDDSSNKSLGVRQTLFTERFDGVAGVFPLAKTPASEEFSVLNQSVAIVPQLSEFVFFFICLLGVLRGQVEG